MCWAATTKDGRYVYVTNGWTVQLGGRLAPVGEFEGVPETAAGLAAT